VIACFSSGKFNSDNTGSVLEKLLRAMHVSFTGLQMYWLNVAIRKAAHFTVYGTLSALFFRAWRGQPQRKRWEWKWALLAICAAFLTACSDEFHQHFTPGRTGVFSDVVLDTTGAIFAQLMIVAWTAQRKIL
jgi:VanZ family protein